jgi:hypothetical protein
LITSDEDGVVDVTVAEAEEFIARAEDNGSDKGDVGGGDGAAAAEGTYSMCSAGFAFDLHIPYFVDPPSFLPLLPLSPFPYLLPAPFRTWWATHCNKK